MGWWLCFSACNLKKDCVVCCLLCLLIDIDTDVKIEEETGVRQQKDSRIREETGRKIKKRRESRGEVRKLARCLSSYCFYLVIVIILLSCSYFSSFSSSLSAETAITLPAECEGASSLLTVRIQHDTIMFWPALSTLVVQKDWKVVLNRYLRRTKT